MAVDTVELDLNLTAQIYKDKWMLILYSTTLYSSTLLQTPQCSETKSSGQRSFTYQLTLI